MNDSHEQAMRETAKHIRTVQERLAEVLTLLVHRGINHDQTKWCPVEWAYFAEATSRLRGLEYGSEEYKASLRELKPAIDHHNKCNRHHPEYFKGGINDMTLIDLIEMLADWKAASERHEDGDLMKSLEINKARFNIPEPIARMLYNTAMQLGWEE